MITCLQCRGVQAPGFHLGVDFGTSHTVAVLRWPDGRTKPLLFDGSPLLPSAVYVDDTGQLVVGRDALDSARLNPGRLEPNPKRRIDEETVLLGPAELPVGDLIAAVLSRVAAESLRVAGELPAVVTITCPAAWGSRHQRLLVAAAAHAGLGEARLVEEPVAAATYFAGVLGHAMPVGTAIVVYDIGAGTFDVSLVERTAGGFRTRAVDGRANLGGLDLDEVLLRRIGEVYGPADPAKWRALTEPTTRHEHRQRQLLRDDVRAAKERLSRHRTADVLIPDLDREVTVTRDEFEDLARPLLAETVRLTARVASHAGFPRERLAGVFLVGGASRIPLVATLVHQGLHIMPTAIEQPELVVAEGSLLAQGVMAVAGASGSAPPGPAGPASAGPAVASPTPPSPAVSAVASPAAAPAGSPAVIEHPPGGPGRPARRRLFTRLLLTVVVALLAGVALRWIWPSNNDSGRPADRPEAVPVACGLVSRASGTAPLPPGQPAPGPSVAPPDMWERYTDPSGFRIDYPKDFRRFGTGVCFGHTGEGRYLGVDQWQQPDTDLVGYWRQKENQVVGGLPGYQLIDIRPRPQYFIAAADWEFRFDDGTERMHALAVAVLTSANRGYAYIWVTRDSTWESNRPELSRLPGVFQPAR